MATKNLDEHIAVTPDVAGGKPRVAGHRITVQNVAIWHERLGQTADEIAAEHQLTLADVYAALAYYFDHRQEIDATIRAEAQWIDDFHAATPSRLSQKLQGKPSVDPRN